MMKEEINKAIGNFRSTPPKVTLMSAMSLPEIRHAKSKSGIGIFIHHKPEMPVVYIAAVTAGGSAETLSPAKAVLTAIMQREGSRKLDSNQISETLDFNGATLKSDISSHHLIHRLYTLRSRLQDVAPLFAEIVCRPTFPERELTVRREALAKNIEISRENVSYLSEVEGERQIMGYSHPLAAEDTPESIRAITAEQIAGFHHRYSASGNLSLYMCGNITPDIERLVCDAFDDAISCGDEHPLTIKRFTAAPAGAENVIRKAGSSQSSIMLSLPAVPRTHPDYLPLHMTVYALGGYFGSRLMLNIREEKGLTYGISASVPGYIDDAYINISAETDNRYARQVINEVTAELRRLATDPPCGDELTRLKQSALSMQAAVLDSPISIMEHYITTLTQGLPAGYFDMKQNTIASLTPAIISEMATRYLQPDYLRISIAGNPE